MGITVIDVVSDLSHSLVETGKVKQNELVSVYVSVNHHSDDHRISVSYVVMVINYDLVKDRMGY